MNDAPGVVKEPEIDTDLPAIMEEENSFDCLLTPAGRVFVEILLNPDHSLKDLSERLHMGESRISKVISSLVRKEMLVRTKSGARNTYQIGVKGVKEHYDIQRLLRALTTEP